MEAEKVVNHILTCGLLVVLCMGTSCTSLAARTELAMCGPPKSQLPISDRIYPGLHAFPEYYGESGWENVLLVIDVPFSFAFDTLMLPFDISGI
jgi:uncharacterized protein YceK